MVREANPTWLFDFVQMRAELCGAFGRTVHFFTRRSVEASDNWIRRQAILTSAESIYAA